ncbi:methyl-accepting chemotaxis protein [Bacillaceae bacterium]
MKPKKGFTRNKRTGIFRWTIGNKLTAGFLAMAVLLAVVGFVAYYSLQKIDRTYADLVERRVLILSNAQEIQAEALRQARAFQRYLATGDETEVRTIQASQKRLKELIQVTAPLQRSQEAKDMLVKIEMFNESLAVRINDAIGTIEMYKKANVQTDMERHAKIGDVASQLAVDLERYAQQLVERQKQFMKEGTELSTQVVRDATLTLTVLSVFAVGLAVAIGIGMTRMITRPIQRVALAANDIAAGDLTGADLEVKNRDEIKDLAEAFNGMKNNLRELIRQVSVSAEQVAASSEELTASAEQTSKATEQIAATMEEVASGTEQQVQSVENISAVITQMSAGVKQMAANAQSVSAAAVGTAGQASQGSEAIQSVIGQMDSIHARVEALAQEVRGLGERSQEIGKIVDVITGIAEQTNLLALNAAIEAARAGEHGRGFAVVANEVRKLAEQSKESAEQIAQLIAFIQKETNNAVETMTQVSQEVEQGMGVVHSTGETFAAIRQSVEEVAKQIEEVTAAVEQMSSGAEQVVEAVEQIAKIAEETSSGTQNVSASTQEQLASMEEISSSAASLAKAAEELQAQVQRFKV